MSEILDESSEAEVQILMLRKPTPLKRVFDAVPKPSRAVPQHGLPQWYRLDLDRKLPVPKIPAGKIVFSRGFIGEDVRKTRDDRRPSFDLTDPFCRTVSYEYEPLHDPHLVHFFMQESARKRMAELGFSTNEGRALCSLKQFNTYRKFLYNRYMDPIHEEMAKLDVRAREDLTMMIVERDTAKRREFFQRSERAYEQLERAHQAQDADAAEKTRLVKEKEAKAQARVDYMIQFKERQRRERVARGREKETRIKQRVLAAAELELRRKITMIRTWRKNENRRVLRLRREAEDKKRKLEEEVNRKWQARIESQNDKIEQDKTLLRLYCDDMEAAATRRRRRNDIRAYNRDLELQRLRLTNWKAIHNRDKAKSLLKKMAGMFEKTQRGNRAVTAEQATKMTRLALAEASSGLGTDKLALLGQARVRLEAANTVPAAVTRILEESIDNAVLEFTRRRVGLVLHDVERAAYMLGARMLDSIHMDSRRQSMSRRKSRTQRRSIQLASDVARQYAAATIQRISVTFGQINAIEPKHEIEGDLRSVRDRPPTPVPSATDLADLIFSDCKEDLLGPVALGANMPERRKLLEMVNGLAKLMSRSVTYRVQRGVDARTTKITLPKGYRTDNKRETTSFLFKCNYIERCQRMLSMSESDASVFIALSKAIQEGRIEPEDTMTDFYVPEVYTSSPPDQ